MLPPLPIPPLIVSTLMTCLPPLFQSESQAHTLFNNSHSPPISLPPCLPSFTALSSSPIFHGVPLTLHVSFRSLMMRILRLLLGSVTYSWFLLARLVRPLSLTWPVFFDYANNSSSESVSLKAALIMPALLLQRPHDTSTTKENVSSLDRRLQLWSEGSSADLLSEGKLIQSRLRRVSPNSGSHNDDHRAAVFANLIMQGKLVMLFDILIPPRRVESSILMIRAVRMVCPFSTVCVLNTHLTNLFALQLVLMSPCPLKATSFILLFLIKLLGH